MQKYRLLVFVIVFCLFFSGCSQEAVSVEKGARVFGSFSTTDMSGNPVNEEIFGGQKLTMVNIWATFCSPCIQEMPDLAQLQTDFGDAVQIIGVVVDAADKNGNILPDKKEKAESVIADTGANYLHLLPSASLNKAYLNTVQSVPETLFVDENGNQIGDRYIGARSRSDWKKIIGELLDSM